MLMSFPYKARKTGLNQMKGSIHAAPGSSSGRPAAAGAGLYSEAAMRAALSIGATPPKDDDAAVQAMFERAHSLALRGDLQEARQICAHAILQFQPLLTREGGMLRLAFAVLIVARSFQLLARLARATSGQTIRVMTVSDEAPLPALLNRQRDSIGVITYTIHCGQWAVLSADHPLILRWSGELTSGGLVEN
jgi:hypothetical protein